MRRWFGISVAVAVAAAFVGVAAGDTMLVLGLNDWDPNPGPNAWTNTYGTTTVDTPANGGNTGGWLRVSFPYTAEPESPTGWADIVRTPATNLFAGTWSTQDWLRTDFWASNAAPGAVQIRWQSTTNANMWGYTLSAPATGVWTTLIAPLQDWTNWWYAGASEAQYLADLSSVSWVGVYIYRNTENEQIYGLDNFMLEVPEPAECILLAAALVTAVCALRRRQRAGLVPVTRSS